MFKVSKAFKMRKVQNQSSKPKYIKVKCVNKEKRTDGKISFDG